MTETLEIGSSPAEEDDCAQLGTDGYRERARRECRAFRHQIIRELGQPPEGAALITKANAHDFGTYYEVAVRFDEGNEAAAAWAYRLESAAPARWDKAALRELADDGRIPSLLSPGVFTIGALLRDRERRNRG